MQGEQKPTDGLLSLPAKIKVDVRAYNQHHEGLLAKLAGWAELKPFIENGLEVEREQFLTYALFRNLDTSDLGSLRKLTASKHALLSAILRPTKTSFIAKAPLDAKEHRAEAMDIGEGLGLCLMDAVYGTHEGDWRRIPEQHVKTLDFVGSSGSLHLELEAKGSFVENRESKSSSVSRHKASISEKKKAQSATGGQSVRLGTIAAIDRVEDGRPTLWVLDPPISYSDRSPEQIRVLHRMYFLLQWLALISPRSPLVVALATRVIDLANLQNPLLLDRVPLSAGPGDQPVLPRRDPFRRHTPFFATKSVVADGPAGGVVVPSGKNHVFFAGVRESIVELALEQDFRAILRYREPVATIRKEVIGLVSRGRFERWGFNEESKAVTSRGPGYLEIALSGELHYSAGGLVFGWLPRPEDL